MIPKISIENLELSKIICGTNQFVGITHRANPIDMLIHLRRFKDPKTVAKFMIHLLQEHGVNCCISSPREKIFNALKITENETGEKYHWICSPSERKTVKNLASDILKQSIGVLRKMFPCASLIDLIRTRQSIKKNSL